MRPMRPADVQSVLAIEQDIYAHPWTLGNFRDSLQAGYSCWVMECEGHLVGYGVLMVGVQEAHLLNLSVAREWQRRGFGRRLLHHFIDLARGYEAQRMFLEVRPSNLAARALYADTGFRQLACPARVLPGRRGTRGCDPDGAGSVIATTICKPCESCAIGHPRY